MNRRISQQTLKLPNMHKLNANKLTYLLFFLVSGPLFAQHYNPSSAKTAPTPSTRDTAKVIDIREKLVQLALQNPTFEIADRQINKSVYELRKAKSSWLNPISAQANVNEVSIHQPITGVPTNGNVFYPRWNVGVMVPLDVFSAKKNDIKIAKENLLIAEAEKNQRYREIKAEVLTAYEDYLMYKDMLDIQARVTQDQYTTLMTRENDYKDALINGEEYNKYLAAYSEQKTKLTQVVRNLNATKIALEAMIGIPLEQALGSK
jgi:outer membrane protein TolC